MQHDAPARTLIAAILNQAIADGMQYTRPRAPHVARQENEATGSRRMVYSREMLAWDGRQFFNAGNDIFCMYCHLIDIDPAYMQKKAEIFFENFDLHGKRHYRNLLLSLKVPA